jgi:hypothetical protein
VKFYCVMSDEYEIGEQWFITKAEAIADAKAVNALEVTRCEITPLTRATILALLNQRGYVAKQETVWTRPD